MSSHPAGSELRLTFRSAAPSAFLPSGLELVRDFCRVTLEPRPRDAGGRVDVLHGEDAGAPCRLRVPAVQGYGAADVPRPPGRVDFDGAERGDVFPFDLFAAARFWLADEGNAGAPDEAFDAHGRLLAARSAQEAVGVRELPIVNSYLILFRHWLGSRLGLRVGRPLPSGKRCAVVLSHDVDRPLDPLALGRLAARRLPRSPLRSVPTLARAAATFVRDPRARHWLFDEVVAAEACHGFRSAFFFASTSRFDRGGHRLDVAYEAGASPFRSLFRELARNGAEVGLHVGYTAHERPDRVRQERERLEEVAGTDVRGSRHHYWHTGRPFWCTLAAHGEAGLAYDSSLAFEEAPGYRLGLAFPHRPWSPETRTPLSTVQVPPMAMDGAFFYDPAATVEGALGRVERLLTQLKRFEGVAALDWHQETSFPGSRRFRRWGEGYLALLDLLAADREVAVMTFAEALELRSGGRSERRG